MTTGSGVSRRNVLGTMGAAAVIATSPLRARAQGGGESRRPNILLILADDMGFADLGCYDSLHISMPELDLLAAQGARLTGAYANSPVCSLTRLALATGRYNRAFLTGLVEPFSPGESGPFAFLASDENKGDHIALGHDRDQR